MKIECDAEWKERESKNIRRVYAYSVCLHTAIQQYHRCEKNRGGKFDSLKEKRFFFAANNRPYYRFSPSFRRCLLASQEEKDDGRESETFSQPQISTKARRFRSALYLSRGGTLFKLPHSSFFEAFMFAHKRT